MGHTVLMFQEDHDTTDNILADARRCDLFLYTHTHGWITPGSFDVRLLIRKLRAAGVTTAGYHLDYWYGLERAADVGKEPFWGCDYVFTADGDPVTQKWFKSLGIENHHWIRPGVVKRDCYIAEPVEAYKHDVIFVGSRDYHKEWSYRPKLIDWLKANFGERFGHYGNDGIKQLRGPELNQLYASAKVAVGDSLCLGFKHKNYWSDRVYETRGRGGFLIHPEIEGLDDRLVKYPYGDFERLKKLINYWVKYDESREALRKQYHNYVRLNHTYNNRMAQMIGVVNAS